jgi:hypothetical protein
VTIFPCSQGNFYCSAPKCLEYKTSDENSRELAQGILTTEQGIFVAGQEIHVTEQSSPYRKDIGPE